MFLATIESLVVGIMPMPSLVTLRAALDSSDEPKDVLPIYIGPIEASAIAAALDGKHDERPLTHSLANNLVQALGGSVSRVVIDRVEGATFFATVYVRCSNGMFTRVDARPSDAIALAIRANAPLFVEEEVMQAASCPRVFNPEEEKRMELEEFDKFIEGVSPEDFATPGKPTASDSHTN